MSETERSYDLLDILRVVKGVWCWLSFVPVMAALLVGIGTFVTQAPSPANRTQATVRFPAAAFTSDPAERLIRSVVDTPSGDNKFLVSGEDIPDLSAPVYRTLRIMVDAAPGTDGQKFAQTALVDFAEAVEEFDQQTALAAQQIAEQRDLLMSYLADFDQSPPAGPSDAVARANSAAALVSALASLDEQAQDLRQRGSGPLVVVSPPETPSGRSNLRWVRYPIVAAIGGLLAVLFVAFTQDGLRLAAERRRDRV
ncbi:hypothetical protein [Devosia faecipullorum]|uniref:hypothetical protein n=1 Tax=Devosia faecipullorum TaxID=2755039 RepID=UPI00187BB0A9|nr:hypothetical protein [Devosia faecipullorum]MBE7734522.1 hypothetical protein [Devosia faecipullorum]